MTETAPATMNNANDTLNTAIANCTNERDSLFNKNKALSIKITNAIKALPRKPTKTAEQIDEEIENLDNSISSVSNREQEREIDRKINNLKKQKREIDEYAKQSAAIEALRKERDENSNKINELKKQLDELYQTKRDKVVIDIVKEGTGEEITSKDIVTETLEVTPEQIKNLDDFHVFNHSTQVSFACAINQKDNVLTLRGKKTGVVIFKSYVTDLLDPAQETLTLDAAKFQTLICHKMRYLHLLQDITKTKLDLVPSTSTLIIKGGQKSIQRGKKEVLAFFKLTKTIETTSFLDHCLFKDQAKDLKALRDQIKGYFHIDTNREEDRCTLTFYGSSEDLDADYALLQQYIADHPQVTFTYTTSAPSVVSYIIGTNGKRSKEIINKSGAILKFNEKGVVNFTISGLQSEVDAAIELVDKLVEQYNREHVLVSMTVPAVKRLMDKKGELLHAIEKETSTKLHMDEQNNCEISGEEANVQKAQASLEVYNTQSAMREYTLPERCVGRFVGEKGKHIQSIRKDMPSVIDCDKKGKVCVCSTEDILTKFDAFIADWVKQFYVESITVEQIAIGSAVIGQDGSVLKEIQSKFSVHINTKKNSNVIEVEGLEENVKKAIEDIRERVDKYFKENVVLSCPSEIIRVCPELRRSAVEKIEKAHEGVKIFTMINDGGFRITGEEKAVEATKAELKAIVDKYQNYAVERTSCHKKDIGVLVGKSGAHIKKIQKDFDVKIDVNEKNEKVENAEIVVFGEKEKAHNCVEYIQKYMEENIMESKSYTLSQKQFLYLINNKMENTNEIQKKSGAHLNFPPNFRELTGTVTVSLRGNKKQMKLAEPLFNEVITGKIHSQYTLAVEDVQKLMKSPSFFVERIELSSKSQIHLNKTTGEVEIIGTKEAIQTAYYALLKHLSECCTETYAALSVAKNVLYVLTAKKISFEEIKSAKNAEIYLDNKNSLIYLVSKSSPLAEVRAEVEAILTKLDKECSVITIEESYIPLIIGAQGKTIKSLMEKNKTDIHVMKTNNDVYVTGKEEDIQNTLQAITELIETRKHLSCAIPASNSVLSSIIGVGGANVRKLEAEYKCSIKADRQTKTIYINGTNKDDVAACKVAIEDACLKAASEELPAVEKKKAAAPKETHTEETIKTEKNAGPSVPPGFENVKPTLIPGLSKTTQKNMKRKAKRQNNAKKQEEITNILIGNKTNDAAKTTVGGSSYYVSDDGYSLDL